MRGFVGRLGDAARATTEGQLGRTDPFGVPRRGGPRATGRRRAAPRPTIAFEAEEIPDLSPLAIAGLVVVAILAALGAAGALAGSWETVLLWQNRVPILTAGGTPVVDPVFGRDVSYYLFELPVPAPRPGRGRRAAHRGAGRRRRALPAGRGARRRLPDAGPGPPGRARRRSTC